MPSMPGTFRSPHLPSRETVKREADQRRGSARQRGYSSSWDKASITYRKQHPLCVGCMAIGRYVAVAAVDHIQPHNGDQRLFWDSDNWQSACAWHHDVVKQRLERMFERGEIAADQLRLDSHTAISLTRRLEGRGE